MTDAAQILLPLVELARDAGLAASRVRTIGRQAVRDGLKKGRTHFKRSTQELLTLKSRSIDSRLRVGTIRSSGDDVSGSLIARENRLPLLTSFRFRGGRPAKSNRPRPSARLRVSVRVGKPAEVYRGAFVRPNPNSETGRVSYQRQFKDGELAGRLPYSRSAGPSPVGLALGRPGFAEAEQEFLEHEIVEQYETRVDREVDRMAGSSSADIGSGGGRLL